MNDVFAVAVTLSKRSLWCIHNIQDAVTATRTGYCFYILTPKCTSADRQGRIQPVRLRRTISAIFGSHV